MNIEEEEHEMKQMDEQCFLICASFLSPREILQNLCLVCKGWQQSLMNSTWLWKCVAVQQYQSPEEMPLTLSGLQAKHENHWFSLNKILIHLKGGLAYHSHSSNHLSDLLFMFLSQERLTNRHIYQLFSQEISNNQSLFQSHSFFESEENRKNLLKNLICCDNVAGSEFYPAFSWWKPMHKQWLMSCLLRNEYFEINANNYKKLLFVPRRHEQRAHQKKALTPGVARVIERLTFLRFQEYVQHFPANTPIFFEPFFNFLDIIEGDIENLNFDVLKIHLMHSPNPNTITFEQFRDLLLQRNEQQNQQEDDDDSDYEDEDESEEQEQETKETPKKKDKNTNLILNALEKERLTTKFCLFFELIGTPKESEIKKELIFIVDLYAKVLTTPIPIHILVPALQKMILDVPIHNDIHFDIEMTPESQHFLNSVWETPELKTIKTLVLLNDEVHSFEVVISRLKQAFGRKNNILFNNPRELLPMLLKFKQKCLPNISFSPDDSAKMIALFEDFFANEKLVPEPTGLTTAKASLIADLANDNDSHRCNFDNNIDNCMEIAASLGDIGTKIEESHKIEPMVALKFDYFISNSIPDSKNTSIEQFLVDSIPKFFDSIPEIRKTQIDHCGITFSILADASYSYMPQQKTERKKFTKLIRQYAHAKYSYPHQTAGDDEEEEDMEEGQTRKLIHSGKEIVVDIENSHFLKKDNLERCEIERLGLIEMIGSELSNIREIFNKFNDEARIFVVCEIKFSSSTANNLEIQKTYNIF